MNFFIRMSTIYCQISIHVRWNKGGKLNKARSIEGSKRSQVELINWCSQVELIYRNDESKCKKARGWTITVWSTMICFASIWNSTSISFLTKSFFPFPLFYVQIIDFSVQTHLASFLQHQTLTTIYLQVNYWGE